MRSMILAFVASLMLSVPASAQENRAAGDAPGPDCFPAGRVGGWGVIDSHTIRVRINANRQYALRTVSSARALRWEMGIALSSFSGWICEGEASGVFIHRLGSMPRSWLVESVVALPPPEPLEEAVQD